MRKGISQVIFFLFLASISATGLAQPDYQRDLSLYYEVITGEKSFDDLSPEEKRLVTSAHRALSASNDNIEGYDFSLRDIERKCEVYKYSDSYGDVECRGYSLRPVERKCEVYFYDHQNGELECRGSDFRVIERKCTAIMYSENYGEIDC